VLLEVARVATDAGIHYSSLPPVSGSGSATEEEISGFCTGTKRNFLGDKMTICNQPRFLRVIIVVSQRTKQFFV